MTKFKLTRRQLVQGTAGIAAGAVGARLLGGRPAAFDAPDWTELGAPPPAPE